MYLGTAPSQMLLGNFFSNGRNVLPMNWESLCVCWGYYLKGNAPVFSLSLQHSLSWGNRISVHVSFKIIHLKTHTFPFLDPKSLTYWFHSSLSSKTDRKSGLHIVSLRLYLSLTLPSRAGLHTRLSTENALIESSMTSVWMTLQMIDIFLSLSHLASG